MTEDRDHRTDEVWTRLAAFGDSIMWGQGLRRNRRLYRRIAALLPKPSGSQQSPGLVHDGSRSGAQYRTGICRQPESRPPSIGCKSATPHELVVVYESYRTRQKPIPPTSLAPRPPLGEHQDADTIELLRE